MIEIGNVYGHGFDPTEVTRLGRLGFAIRPGTSHYAGAQVMRFIDFERGPSLELGYVTDLRAYADFAPEGMVPYCPGINLLLTGPGASLDDYARRTPELRPYPLHVNYDGSADAGKPGWNYLNFGVPLVKDTFIWLTTLDEPRPVRPRPRPHPNGATKLRGLWFDLEPAALQPVAKLVGGEVQEGALAAGGVTWWSKEAVPDVPGTEGKRFPLRLIVLETNTLGPFGSEREGMERNTFDSRPALRLRTNPLSWDLLLVEGERTTPTSP
jgi:hypothetical protein